MPIDKLFRAGKISPEEVQRLDRAFALTLKTLHFVDRNDVLCEVVARKVVEVDATGTRDPEEIAERAVRELGVPPY
jgi:hypothetical protein